MDPHFRSRIPLSVSKRQNIEKAPQRYLITPICLNERYCDSLANTSYRGPVPRNQFTNIAETKILAAHISAATKKPSVQLCNLPMLDDYKGRYKNLLAKFATLNNEWTLTKAELKGCKEENGILTGKLVTAETEIKSVRHELKRLKVTNRTNELTVAVLQRKIDELKVRTDDSEEQHSTRSGRCVRAPEKYQANSS